MIFESHSPREQQEGTMALYASVDISPEQLESSWAEYPLLNEMAVPMPMTFFEEEEENRDEEEADGTPPLAPALSLPRISKKAKKEYVAKARQSSLWTSCFKTSATRRKRNRKHQIQFDVAHVRDHDLTTTPFHARLEACRIEDSLDPSA